MSQRAFALRTDGSPPFSIRSSIKSSIRVSLSSSSVGPQTYGSHSPVTVFSRSKIFSQPLHWLVSPSPSAGARAFRPVGEQWLSQSPVTEYGGQLHPQPATPSPTPG